VERLLPTGAGGGDDMGGVQLGKKKMRRSCWAGIELEDNFLIHLREGN
jgi:hypothetical protein